MVPSPSSWRASPQHPAHRDPNRVTTFTPAALCVRRGDYLGFSDEGGFAPPLYPNGVPFQVFSSVAGSQTDIYSRGKGIGNGSNFTGAPLHDEELLMQIQLGTGADAGHACGGTSGRKLIVLTAQTVHVKPGGAAPVGMLPHPPHARVVTLTVVLSGPSGKHTYTRTIRLVAPHRRA